MKSLGQPFAVGRTAEIYAWEDGTILKLYRDWCPPDWVEHEAHVSRLVNQAGIPAPKVGDIVTVNGRSGVLYQRLDGISMLNALQKNPLKVMQYARTLAQLHLEMHRCSGADLPSQRSSLTWSIEHAEHLPEHLRLAALERLAGLPEGDKLCHGDFHPDNLILTKQGPIVIDWMTAARGNPSADMARSYLLLSLGDPPQKGLSRSLILAFRGLFVRGYLSTYRDAAPETVAQARAFLPVVAAARMNEDIAPEREKLLNLIERSLNQAFF